MKPWINAALYGAWLVFLIPSQADAQALPPGVSRIVFHGTQIVRFAYVPERTSSGIPLHWPGSCVFIRPHSAGTTHIEGDTEQAVIAGVLAHWQSSTLECGYLRFIPEAPGVGDAGLDYVNRIIFREDRWDHDPMVGAVTTLLFVDIPGAPDDGVILDADIELNAVNYAIGICNGTSCTTEGTAEVTQDLANQLTHEIGHLVGLGHTCRTATEPAMTGTDGEPVLLCTDPDVPFDATTSTMYPVSAPEEIRRASLTTGDIEDFCEIYPLAEDPESCAAAMPRDAGPPPTDGGTDAGTGDAGTEPDPDSSRPDADATDSGPTDLGTASPDAGPTNEPDSAIRRDGAIHTLPPKDEGSCACAVGQRPERTSAAPFLLGLVAVGAFIRRRRR